MSLPNELTIGFVRRGFSSGGAEAYLKRLGAGVAAAGHDVVLFTAAQWPAGEWNFGRIVRVKESSAIGFADALEKLASDHCDVLLSLERVSRWDVYRAGDVGHRAWLERRDEIAGPLQKLRRFLNRKHSAALELEEALLKNGGAGRVIANSQMVRDEIIRFYGYPAAQIDIVYNGLPLDAFQRNEQDRSTVRHGLGLTDEEIVVLFAGSGWERKGLRFAIAAVKQNGDTKLIVAGRG